MTKVHLYWVKSPAIPSDELLNGIIESATDAIVAIDERHRIILYNPAAERLFGYKVEEALGQDLSLLLPEHVAEKHFSYVKEFLKTGHSPVLGKVMEGIAKRKNGKTFPIEISRSATRIDNHWIFTAIVRDVTHELEMERRLLESEKLAAVGMAASRIVHEIKNPLIAIGGLVLSLLKKETKEERRQKLELILREIKCLEKLLSDISEFAKPLKLELTETNIVALCQEALEFYEPRFEENSVKVHLIAPKDEIKVVLDEGRIKEVLFNLFQNAIEAMSTKGGGELTVEIVPEKEKVRLIVRDTGPGIPEQVLKHLFTPFFTTKKKGTGLGLSISHKIIEAHGGKIYARNYEKGAEFIIELPYHPPEAKAVES
ncbi:two-component system sensor histidine kinase NtrB [Thermodesulfatator atlanticus]|uniref:two-component system sensor histidine kinase NtrB n=1 Tax=Thermodesulfatator atlanticus TaxID=501497 RepID=UPI0003B4ADDE|nr:ATP-binding protein [Thermodesulfatator atlanticus]